MTGMPTPTLQFDDAEAYERFMGPWSRRATAIFVDWLSPPRGARWLDVGCGTGILAQHVVEHANPQSVDAVDPAATQVAHAARALDGTLARFHVAAAERLPFDDGAFDVVASALVLNFLRDPRAGVGEMQRVARSGALVAGFVWDFAAERSPSWPMREGLRSCGVALPPLPGADGSTVAALRALFADVGLASIETCSFDVTVSFPAFGDFWIAQMPGYSPTTRMIDAMSEGERSRLKDAVRRALATDDLSKPFGYSATANAIKAVTGKR
jgi:SAM-dependent methyltransferase